MDKIREKEIKQAQSELLGILAEKNNSEYFGIFAAANIAMMSLKADENTVKENINEIFTSATAACIEEYMDLYSSLSVLGAKIGETALRGILTVDEYLVHGRRNDYTTNPSCLTKLLLSLHHLSEADSYAEYGAGLGNGAIAAAKVTDQVTTMDISVYMTAVTEIRAYWQQKNVVAIHGDMLRSDNLARMKAGKTTVDMPIGMRISNIRDFIESPLLEPYKKIIERSRSMSWRYALTAYMNNPEGRVIAIMEPNSLFAAPEGDIRKTLINQGIIEGIIELPDNFFYNTSIKLCLVILSKNNHSVKFMDTSNMATIGRRQKSFSDEQINEIVAMYDGCKDNCIEVSAEEIAEADYVLAINRYTQKGSSVQNGVPLAELCSSIKRGSAIMASSLEEIASNEPTKYRYLMLKHVLNGRIDTELPYLSKLDEKQFQFCLDDGDLVMSKMLPLKIGIVHVSEGEKVLANGNLYRINVDKEKIHPVYLMLYLQSEKGAEEMSKYANGGGMKTISIKDLGQVMVPVIPMSEQMKIVERYEKLNDRLSEIEKEKAIIKDSISNLVLQR